MIDDAIVAECWDTNAEAWTRQVRAGYDVFRDLYNNPAFFEMAGDLVGLDLLDAGCGEGKNTRLMARAGARVTGVDIAEGMIAAARAEEAREPLGIRYEVASMSAMECLGDATFDAILSTMALMDCADYEGCIVEFRRVLRPGGMLAFNICHPCFTNDIRGWERNEIDRPTGLIVGEYYDETPTEETWRFRAAGDDGEEFTVIYFNRTLAGFINPLCDAGFRVERLIEPRPSEEACRAEPRLEKYRRLVPHFFGVRARRDDDA